MKLMTILFSAPPQMNASPVPFNLNGAGGVDMQNFLGLLEHEEADFVDQVKKSKAFIQKIIKDKEELGLMVANHTTKIKKLELERMDYQKRIIEVSENKPLCIWFGIIGILFLTTIL